MDSVTSDKPLLATYVLNVQYGRKQIHIILVQESIDKDYSFEEDNARVQL